MSCLTTEPLPFTVPITRDVYHQAENFSREQKHPEKARQVYLNTLAVLAVEFYCQCMEVETNLTASDSWSLSSRTLMDVADMVITDLGKLECRPVLPGEQSCHVPGEVRCDRVGYVVVEIDEENNRSTLLGFAKNALAGELKISQLDSLEALIYQFPETVVEPVPTVVKLLQWFEGVFEPGWQAVEELWAPRSQLGYARSASGFTVKRAKVIDLGLLLNGETVALVVNLQHEANNEVGILVQVQPMGDRQHLPPGLKLQVNLESDSAEVEAREADNYIQLEFSQRPGRRFNVQVYLGDGIITEEFAVEAARAA